MTRQRRVSKLESSLSTAESVLLWLDEVQRYASVADYARATLDQPDFAAPLDRILDRVSAATSETLKGSSSGAAQRAAQRELRDAVFLYCLVLQLNAAAVDAATRLTPLALALIAQLRNLGADPLSWDETARADDRIGAARVDRGWRAWYANAREVLEERVVAAETRTQLEQRHFGGRSVLFADVAEEGADAKRIADRLRSFVDALPRSIRAKVRQGRETPHSGTETIDARVTELLDDARLSAYHLLGERAPAIAILKQRLRQTTDPR